MTNSIDEWSQNPNRYNVNPKEIERRRNQMNDLKNKENAIFRNKNSYSNMERDDNLYNGRKYMKGNQQETERT